mmetsp:Transcript_44149/g.87604  ORF Transcript_44149/g.87604 Transcript_44149/m.87604 type:complete len:86 (-) Transcript_44149:205-462(-)
MQRTTFGLIQGLAKNNLPWSLRLSLQILQHTVGFIEECLVHMVGFHLEVRCEFCNSSLAFNNIYVNRVQIDDLWVSTPSQVVDDN